MKKHSSSHKLFLILAGLILTCSAQSDSAMTLKEGASWVAYGAGAFVNGIKGGITKAYNAITTTKKEKDYLKKIKSLENDTFIANAEKKRALLQRDFALKKAETLEKIKVDAVNKEDARKYANEKKEEKVTSDTNIQINFRGNKEIKEVNAIEEADLKKGASIKKKENNVEKQNNQWAVAKKELYEKYKHPNLEVIQEVGAEYLNHEDSQFANSNKNISRGEKTLKSEKEDADLIQKINKAEKSVKKNSNQDDNLLDDAPNPILKKKSNKNNRKKKNINNISSSSVDNNKGGNLYADIIKEFNEQDDRTNKLFSDQSALEKNPEYKPYFKNEPKYRWSKSIV